MSDELPPGWALTDIGTLGRYVNGRGFGKDEWKKVGLPIIRIQNLNDESAEFNYTDQEHESKYRVTDGDLLVAWAASLGVYYWNRGPAWLNQHIFRVEVEERAVTKPFLYYTLKHALEGLYKKAHGSGMVHVTKGKFDSHPVKLPPLNEQKRIVSKIDELFSRIDEGERALERVQRLVERYRQSVLKAAVTGELTRDWREKNKDQLESGEALLARILKARREAWEKAELDKMKAKGITPANDKWKQKYEEPAALDESGLPELPEGWAWSSGAQLFEWASGDFLPAKAMKPGDVPVYGGNGLNGQHSEANVDFATIVVGRVGVHCGNVHLSEPKCWVTDNAIYATRLPTPACLDFLLICLRFAQLGKTSQGGAQPFVNQKALNEVVVAMPPLDEQNFIVDVLAMESSRIDAALATVAAELRRSAALRQSVLRSAFAGLLVSQQPDDEPAVALLERISAERSEAPAKPKRGRKPKTSEPA